MPLLFILFGILYSERFNWFSKVKNNLKNYNFVIFSGSFDNFGRGNEKIKMYFWIQMSKFKCWIWNLNLELNLSSRSQNWYISTEDRKEKLWLKSIGCRMMSSSIYALIEIAALRVRYSRATQNCYNNTYSHCLLAF